MKLSSTGAGAHLGKERGVDERVDGRPEAGIAALSKRTTDVLEVVLAAL